MASTTLPTRALTAALFTLLAWAATPFTTQAQLPDYLPTDGLVGWWPFNGNANDESGNGNDGTVNGATLTEDREGNANAAFGFDGIDDFIQVMDSPSFNFQLNNSISASYWIRQLTNSSSQLDLVLAKQIGSGDTQNGWNSGITTNGLSNFRVMSGQGSVPLGMSGAPVSLNAWTLLTFVYDQGVYQTYVNGELEQSGLVDPIAVVGTSTSNLFIGKPSWVANNVKSFNGDIDDIAIYNRALTPEEITALYTGIPYIAPCADPTACNFEQEGECVYAEPNLDCDGNCLNDADGDGVCDEFEILGCTDTMACNYMVEATDDDASCAYPLEPYLDCADNCLNDTNNNGICDELDVPGCTFEGACNYNPEATVNDNSCFFATAVFDCNGNCQLDANNNGICDQLEAIGAQLCGEGTVWDNATGTCIGFDPCPADFNNSGVVEVADLLLFLAIFGENCD